MLRFLDGEAANAFNRWIEEGRFAKMDAKIMWRLLQRHFCDPSEERQIARREITNRVQRKDENIMAYEQVFVEIANRADLSQEERVAQWTKNITPHVADACLLYVAQQDRTFEDVARYARRVDRITPDMRTPQVALNGMVDASSARTNDRSGKVDGGALPELSIQVITETVRKQLAQEMASKQHLEDTVGQLKREIVLQVQRDQVRSTPDGLQRGRARQLADAPVHSPNFVPGQMYARLEESQSLRGQGLIKHGTRPPRLPVGICHKCGAQGHMAKECTWAGKCSYCGRENHQEPVCYERIRAEAKVAEGQTAGK